MSRERVLVTGGSGFLGAHCILALLAAGYQVRTTVRSLDREAEVRAMIEVGHGRPGGALSLVATDLTSDTGWREAVAGCQFVLHVASPFPFTQPKDESELIVPAREGTLRVLRAAHDARVKRVVLTSSFAAIGYGHETLHRPFTEADWSDTDVPGVSAYAKSKTWAERAAWDFVAREGADLELAVINPVAIFGPVLGSDYCASVQIIAALLAGAIPRLAHVSLGVVDVRDVADLHLRAMTHPAATGQRFLATGGLIALADVAALLRSRLGPTAARVPTKSVPDWMVRVVALFSPRAREVLPQLGPVRTSSSEKARRELGWAPRPGEETILATAESLIRFGPVQKSGRKPRSF